MRGKLGVAGIEGHEQAGTGREGRPCCRSSVTFSIRSVPEGAWMRVSRNILEIIWNTDLQVALVNKVKLFGIRN